MLAVAVAVLAWAVVVFAPGLALCYALRPSAGLARNSSLATPLGVGLAMAIAQAFDLTGIAIRPATVVPLEIGISVVALAAKGRRERHFAVTDQGLDGDASRFGPRLLAFGMAAGAVTWCVSIPGVSAVIPSTDGAHHGLYAHRILEYQTIDPHIVLAGDVASQSPTWHYYPIAVHLCAALVSGFSGVAINTVLTVGMVLAASVVLPLGTYVLTMRLSAGNRVVAGVAGILSATFPWFPFAPIVWGGLPMIVAMSQVPASVDALCGALTDRPRVRVGLLLGLSGYSLFEQHNSELIAPVLFGVIIVGSTWRSIPVDDRHAFRTACLVGGALAAALVAPDISKLISGVGERTAYLNYEVVPRDVGPIHWILGAANPLVLLFAVAGIFVVLRRRAWTGWLLCLVVTTALYVAGFGTVQPFEILTAPWYSTAPRISYLFSYFAVTFGALGLVELSRVVRRQLGTAHHRPPSRVILSIPVVSLAVSYLLLVLVEAHLLVSVAYSQGSKVSVEQRAGFAWLAAHVRPGARVLNEFPNGSGWMETLDNVHPVFASDPKPTPIDHPAIKWGERWYLLTHAATLDTNQRVQSAVRDWDVQFVYVSTDYVGVVGDYKPHLKVPALVASGAYQVVWHRGSVTILSVDLPNTTP